MYNESDLLFTVDVDGTQLITVVSSWPAFINGLGVADNIRDVLQLGTIFKHEVQYGYLAQLTANPIVQPEEYLISAISLFLNALKNYTCGITCVDGKLQGLANLYCCDDCGLVIGEIEFGIEFNYMLDEIKYTFGNDSVDSDDAKILDQLIKIQRLINNALKSKTPFEILSAARTINNALFAALDAGVNVEVEF